MKDLDIKKAAMTGACGPIGLALLRYLLNRGIEVLVFQRKNSVRKYLLPVHPFLKIEYYDLEHLNEYKPDTCDYDAFFHLGWANTWIEDRERLDKQMENVTYTCYAVETANRLGCKVFVGVGSQSEYGTKDELLTSDMVCNPENPYGIMKVCACYSSQLLCRQYGIRHVWARVLSAYGYFDNAYSVLISSIRNYIEEKPLLFSKGEQIWDFIYTDDVAHALFLMAMFGVDGKKYPVGCGRPDTLRGYIEKMGNVLGCMEQIQIGALPYRENDRMYLAADISDLTNDTGWKPVMSFEDGISRVYKFYKKWDCKGDGRYRNRMTNREALEFGIVWDSIEQMEEN